MAVKKEKTVKKAVAKAKPAVKPKTKLSKKLQHDNEPRSVTAEIVSDDDSIDLEPVQVDNDEPEFDTRDVVEIAPKKEIEKGLARTTDPLTLYLSEVRKYPVLTREQELELAKKYYDTKDPVLAQTLVKSNLRFVVKIAAEYAKFSSKLIDVIQEGNVGLMHAVKEFNPYKGNRLITYAVWWIRGYIQEYLMRQFSMVRIGTTANQRKLFYQLQRHSFH